jgi:CRISPR-associated protein Csc2
MLNTEFFNTIIPGRPSGKYAHVVMLRVTEGYAVFQTDGELNRARIATSTANDTPMTRITLFKRKQTTPERLNGRELLRRYGVLPEECVYNENSCNRCPDCITYGFAVGTGGSEKSKVYADTAFSLTDYAASHEVFTLNAPYEDGTMSDQGVVTSRISQQDHVKPGTIFPSVITTRDLTTQLFVYVVNNILRTNRYGATTTRGGTVKNHIVAVVLSDGEIFSNLAFTQRLHAALPMDRYATDPVPVGEAIAAAQSIIPQLLAEDSVRDQQVLMGDNLNAFLDQVRGLNESQLEALLREAFAQTEAYHGQHIAKQPKSKASK